ncbi:MAG: hypothetical protein MHPSP_001792, partial [Paramarteilia canceri]
VNKNYIEDRFNLENLLFSGNPSFKSTALEIIKSNPDKKENSETISQHISDLCIELYGLIHARYILTYEGAEKMRLKIEDRVYGTCPRVLCYSQSLLPMGVSNKPKERIMVLFCPKCNEQYRTMLKNQIIDGSYYGLNFPQMYYMWESSHRPALSKKKWQIVSDDSDSCQCHNFGIYSPKRVSMIFHDVSKNHLYFDSTKFDSLQEWLVGLPGNQIFVTVPTSYFKSDEAKAIIDNFITNKEEWKNEIMYLVNLLSGVELYGMVHASYCLTAEGISNIYSMWEEGIFGRCKRFSCKDSERRLFPVSVCPIYYHKELKFYCFGCNDAYHNSLCKKRNVLDGSFFPITLLYRTMLNYPNMAPDKKFQPFSPKLFGFEIHPEVYKIEE